jgi:uncharacterized DUF497 family protein
MTRVRVKELVWDKWNTGHIKKHDVTVSQVEEVAKNIIAHKRAKGGRYLIIGRVGSRILSVIITRERNNVYYPITARDAAKKERQRVYEKERKKIS